MKNGMQFTFERILILGLLAYALGSEIVQGFGV